MGEYGAPFVGRAAAVAFVAASTVWTAVIVVSAVRGGPFSVGYAAFSTVLHLWNSYWFLCRIAVRVSLREGVLEWQAPLRADVVHVADITSVRFIMLLPNLMSIRRRDGRSLLIMCGKGLGQLVAGVVQQRPDLDHALGPWARWADRTPGPSWFRPGRHYRSSVRPPPTGSAGVGSTPRSEPGAHAGARAPAPVRSSW